MDVKPVRWECTCRACGKDYSVLAAGPERLCDECARPLIDFIFGRRSSLPEHVRRLL